MVSPSGARRPGGRVFDTIDEHVDTDVSSLVPAGSHVVVVRAF